MAIYRTTDTELTSIANAIRAKTGGSSSLVYPTGFVSAINGISTGGGSSSYNLVLKDVNGDTTSSNSISNDITLGVKGITPSSSAQIITPETGLDGYHTINVGATPTYSYLGEEATFVQNLYNQELSLDDTSFSSWTPSTTATTILAAQNITPQIYLPVQYDYIIKTFAYVKYAYTEAVTNTAITDYFMISFHPMGQRPNSITSLINSNFDYVTYTPSFANMLMIFYNSSGTLKISGNNYGITVAAQGPANSNNSSTTDFGLTPKTPQIRAVANASYMSTTAFSKLDTANTKIYLRIDLYRCASRNDAWHATIQEMIDAYNTYNPTT